MQREKFMANQILARRKRFGDRSRPFQCIDDGVAGPFSGVLGSGDETLVVDFEL